MQHFMLERQRAEIARLKTQQRTLVATTRANLASQSRIHAAVLAILAAQGFEQLIQIVTTDLAVLLDADVVTIGVEQAGPTRPRLHHNGVQILDAGTVDARARRRARGGALRRADRRSQAVRQRRRAGAIGGDPAAQRQRRDAAGAPFASARAAPASSTPARGPNCSASSPARSPSPSRHGSTCRRERVPAPACAAAARAISCRARSEPRHRRLGPLARRRAPRLAPHPRRLWPRPRRLPRFSRRASGRPARSRRARRPGARGFPLRAGEPRSGRPGAQLDRRGSCRCCAASSASSTGAASCITRRSPRCARPSARRQCPGR